MDVLSELLALVLHILLQGLPESVIIDERICCRDVIIAYVLDDAVGLIRQFTLSLLGAGGGINVA